MRVLIVGCERSGTKLLADKIGLNRSLGVVYENKHTIASFKYQQELNRWNKYEDSLSPTTFTYSTEKHSLNLEINIDFLMWVKKRFPDVEIHYMVRNGLDVVSSMTNRTWGNSQTGSIYEMDVRSACSQWNYVINKTWFWAHRYCTIHRYEDYSNVVRTPLSDTSLKVAKELLKENLKLTGYA